MSVAALSYRRLFAIQRPFEQPFGVSAGLAVAPAEPGLGRPPGAQTAFNTYQRLNQDLSSAAGATSSSSSSSQLTSDMSALGNGLTAGDLQTARSAFTAVQTNMKSSPTQSLTRRGSSLADFGVG
jgi:predicted lipoprotein